MSDQTNLEAQSPEYFEFMKACQKQIRRMFQPWKLPKQGSVKPPKDFPIKTRLLERKLAVNSSRLYLSPTSLATMKALAWRIFCFSELCSFAALTSLQSVCSLFCKTRTAKEFLFVGPLTWAPLSGANSKLHFRTSRTSEAGAREASEAWERHA